MTEMPNSAKTSSKGEVFLVSGPDRAADPRRVLKSVLRRADALGRRAGVRRYLATGGETAAGLCARWGLFSWRLVGRVGTGTALCAPDGKDDFFLITKPGGFGNERALIAAVDKLRRAGRS